MRKIRQAVRDDAGIDDGRKNRKHHTNEIKHSINPGSSSRRIYGWIKKLEKELVHLTDFLSHDLRSNMVSICGFSALLAEELKGARHGRSRHYIRRVEENIRSMDISIQAITRQIRSTFSADDFYGPNTVGQIRSFRRARKTKGGENGGRTI